MDLLRHVEASLAALGVNPTDPLGVACSGGADSIALTHLLAASRERLVVLHVDHALRADAEGDLRFVERTADALGATFLAARVTVTPTGDGIEADARRARYAALEQMAIETGLRFVATAHTLDDQAETVLLRTMRGGGLDAIAPVRGTFVRPLLEVRRHDLRGWLADREIDWREDPTNADLRFERNWVRNVLLPTMTERRAGAPRSLAAIAQRHREDRDALDALAADVFSRAAVDDVGVLLSSDELDLAPVAISSRVIRLAFRHLRVDPSQRVIESVRVGEQRRLTCAGVDTWRLDDGIALVAANRTRLAQFAVPRRGSAVSEEWAIRIRVGSSGSAPWSWRVALPDGATSVAIRPRLDGDRVATSVGHKKVQDVLVDAKVPRPLRDLVPVLDVDGGAYAVVGYGGCRGAANVAGAVIDVEPFRATWSRERAWIAR